MHTMPRKNIPGSQIAKSICYSSFRKEVIKSNFGVFAIHVPPILNQPY